MDFFFDSKRKWKLLVRHVTGETTRQEDAEVQALISVDEESAEMLDQLQNLWALAKQSNANIDPDAAWEPVRAQIEREANVTRLGARSSFASRSPRRSAHSAGRQLVRMAAVVLVVVVISVLMLWIVREEQHLQIPDQEPTIYATRNGQRATIQLADGTVVQLQAGSRLEIPFDFSGRRRDVALDGEGYFNVSEDAGSPFRVRTEITTVEVLGTTFNVRAYPEDAAVQVVVAEGQVALHPASTLDTLLLRPRDLGVISRGAGHLIRREVDLSQHLAWTEGYLVFTNAAFSEVAAELERWYDLQVDFVGKPTAGDGLTAVFGSEPLSEILSVIALALDLDYKREQRRVTFFPASAKAN